MEKTRTLAFQIPEDLYQRIKEYLQRNNMTQRQFVIGLIEEELQREQEELEAESEAVSDEQDETEDDIEEEESAGVGDFEDGSDGSDEDEDETEDMGPTMSM